MLKFLFPFTTAKNFVRSFFTFVALLAYFFFLNSCSNEKDQHSTDTGPRAIETAQMDDYVKTDLLQLLTKAGSAASKDLDDSTRLLFFPAVHYYYSHTDYAPIWSSQEKWKPYTDSLMIYLANARTDGLFPEHYQLSLLQSTRQLLDSNMLKRKDPALWAKADLLLSDAFFHVLQDLKQGRLQPDSLGWKNSPEKQENFFSVYMNRLLSGDSIGSIVKSLQPEIRLYQSLKKSIPAFLDSMDTKSYTYLQYPYKDSLVFLKELLVRLNESGYNAGSVSRLDSAGLAQLLIRYQSKKGLKETGKVNAALVNSLNNTDHEKLKRIAITLDKLKKLPAQLPEKYIWVNLPSYKLEVRENDSLVMESKVIIGKPGTPTPKISSQITDLVIFPTWTVPNSIIMKELLPGLKQNPGYLARKGLALYDNNGELVDPWSVTWSRYKKGIPYFIRQGSGDDNALGVIKFNFKNPYSVYLHDTNQRYLFKNKMRSLSHGCVRVEDWKKLAFYIARNDSLYYPKRDSLNFNTDSITSWIVQKERHVVPVKRQIPIFILYFGCEGAKGTVKFYDDVYGEDKVLREKYFTHK
jgi:murein L,D-transpeptidase YcbB/YkuD